MGAPDSALLSLNTATVRAQWNLLQIIDGCARHGIQYISPWRDQVAAVGLKEAAQRVRDNGLKLSGYCRGGMFPAIDRAERKAALDDNRRAVDEALTLGAPCLVLVVGGLPKDPEGRVVSKDLIGAREMVRDGIGELLDYARSAGMPLAIEPLHPMYAADRACVNTMAHANDLCDELGGPGLGIAVDVYHVWWDPNLRREIERAANATPSRLLAYHICDWLVPTTDLLLDRGMMGDGVIDLPLIRSWMENAGYHGPHEVEIFSAHNWWKRDPDEVLLTCKFRHAEVT
ncbi:MAG TPA: sugar phosphate isomerase/epimerase family protein [Casimicrobiaceae bacterium]|nr:sugar phosphate isomerase/epimerase family protein [Casimicrobiaceae bacterium]